MKVLVISLPEATGRRASVASQMKELCFSYSFVEGVRVSAAALEGAGYTNKARLLRYGYSMSPGEVGCFLAHREAWRTVCAHNERCLILEDDVVISKATTLLLERIHRGPYPLVRLAGIFEKRHKSVRETGYAKYWGDPSGAAAYVVTPEAAHRLLKKSMQFFMAVDDFLEARHLHGLNMFAVLPYPIKQDRTDSYINDRGERPLLPAWKRLQLMAVRIPTDIHKYFRRIVYYYF